MAKDPETVRKMADMILKMEMDSNKLELLLLCGLALCDEKIVKDACELGADPNKPISKGNRAIMQQFGYFMKE